MSVPPWRQAMAGEACAVPGRERTGVKRWSAARLGGIGLHGPSFGLGHFVGICFGWAPAGTDVHGTGGGAGLVCSASIFLGMLFAPDVGHSAICASDEAAEGRPEELLRLLHWIPTCEFQSKSELLGVNMLCHLQHLHRHFEEPTYLVVISSSWYAMFNPFHMVEIYFTVCWSIESDAQSLQSSSWNQFIIVNRWRQVSITAEILHYNYVQIQESSVKGRPIDPLFAAVSEVRINDTESNQFNYLRTSMQIDGSAIFLVEQGIISMFGCTKLCLYDDLHGEDVVPVVRVDPPAVDDNTSAVVPQIQRRGLLRLNSVTDIQYLQLITPLPDVHTPDRPSGGHQLV